MQQHGLDEGEGHRIQKWRDKRGFCFWQAKARKGDHRRREAHVGLIRWPALVGPSTRKQRSFGNRARVHESTGAMEHDCVGVLLGWSDRD